MAVEFRKKLTNDIWHFCSNCAAHWPTAGYVSSEELSRGQQLCNECIVKNQLGKCEQQKID
jgi:hypothetical protein